nr:hypothetical protein [Tanacetum cinerariifolium]
MQCLFWKMCKAYTIEDFGMAINELRSKRPDVYKKLIEAGVERWSRAYCLRDPYNYMTIVTHTETDDEDRFKMVFIAFGVVIIPIAIGVSQGETGPSLTWFLSKLKECIGEIPNLIIISDRHAVILSSCEAVFPYAFHGYCCRHLMMNCKLKSIKMQCLFWKMCKAYTIEDFGMAINELRSKRPDVYKKLIEAGVERWSRAYCLRDPYNYMTSNSTELINSLTRDV